MTSIIPDPLSLSFKQVTWNMLFGKLFVLLQLPMVVLHRVEEEGALAWNSLDLGERILHDVVISGSYHRKFPTKLSYNFTTKLCL